MRSFVIGKTRSRWVIALVVGITAAAVVSALAGRMVLLGETGRALLAATDAPWLAPVASAVVFLLLGLLALQGVVTSATYWKLDGAWIRYRSNAVSADFLRYAWDVLRGREPEVDVNLAVDEVRRVRVTWQHQIVSLQFVAHGTLPMSVYPVTVEVVMADGVRASFTGLDRDISTLGAALRALRDLPGVAVDDADDLIDHMVGEQGAFYTYLDKLVHETDRHESASAGPADDVPEGR